LWRRRRRSLTLLPLPFRTRSPRSRSNRIEGQRTFETNIRRRPRKGGKPIKDDTFKDGFPATSCSNTRARDLDFRSSGFFQTRHRDFRRSDLLDLFLALIVRIVVPSFVLVAAMKADNIVSRNRG